MDPNEVKKQILEQRDALTKTRGEILTYFVDIENLISALLTNHYAKPEMASDFSHKLLDDPYIPTIAKINALEKTELMTGYEGLGQDLRRLNNLRNLIAHSTQFGWHGHIIDSKTGAPVKVDEKIAEFNTIYQRADAVLMKIFDSNVAKWRQEQSKTSS